MPSPSGTSKQPIDSVTWVSRGALKPNSYNPNTVHKVEMKLLRNSLLQNGWTQPIVVLADGCTIVDGYHRWLCSEHEDVAALTDGLVPVVECNLDEAGSIAATVRHNRARGVHGIDPMADIVQSLSALGLSQKQIRAQLGMCTEEVKRLLETLPLQKQVTRDNGTELQKAWTPKPGFVDYLET